MSKTSARHFIGVMRICQNIEKRYIDQEIKKLGIKYVKYETFCTYKNQEYHITKFFLPHRPFYYMDAEKISLEEVEKFQFHGYMRDMKDLLRWLSRMDHWDHLTEVYCYISKNGNETAVSLSEIKI